MSQEWKTMRCPPGATIPSRSCRASARNSSRPLPSTESASEIAGDVVGKIVCSRRRRSLSGKGRGSAPSSQRIDRKPHRRARHGDGVWEYVEWLMRREYSPPDEITLAGARHQVSVEEHDSPALTRTPFCWFSPLVMTHPIRCAMLLSIPGCGADYCHAGDCHSERLDGALRSLHQGG
jgi:hypothetical protein